MEEIAKVLIELIRTGGQVGMWVGIAYVISAYALKYLSTICIVWIVAAAAKQIFKTVCGS